MSDNKPADLSHLTASVVAAYVSNNRVQAQELGQLIATTYEALKTAGQPPAEAPSLKVDKAAIRKSIGPDFLTSFIDGGKYKTLTRHLSANGLSAEQYRQTYGLPHDYPIVAQGYSANRREMAKARGLGRRAAAPDGE